MPSTQAMAPSSAARYMTGWPSFLSAIGGPSQVWATITPSFIRPFFWVSASFQMTLMFFFLEMHQSVTFSQTGRIFSSLS
jgi:hypothetical protein